MNNRSSFPPVSVGRRLRSRTEKMLFDEGLKGGNSEELVNGQHEMGHTHRIRTSMALMINPIVTSLPMSGPG